MTLVGFWFDGVTPPALAGRSQIKALQPLAVDRAGCGDGDGSCGERRQIGSPSHSDRPSAAWSSAAGALRCDEGNRPLGLLLVGKCLSVLFGGVEMRQGKFGKPCSELVEVKGLGADRDLGGEHSVDCRLRAFDRNASSGNDPQVQGVGL